jgi:transcriptional regulator with XRE-family HTH domain
MARRRTSQETVATHLGMSRAAVGRRLDGEVPFKITELRSIAALLDVPLASLTEPATALAEGAA